MALSVAEAEAIMEGFTHRFPPHLPYVRDLLRKGVIGDIKIIRAEVIHPTADWENDMCEAYTGTMQAVGGVAIPRELIQPRKELKQSVMQ